MTLDVATYGNAFVVAGTDSRGTFGNYASATATLDMLKKYYIVSDHVVILFSGAAEVGSDLVEQYILERRDDPIDGVTNVVRSFREFIARKWDEYFQHVPFKNRIVLVFIVAGLDEVDDVYIRPAIFTLNSRIGFAPGVSRYGFACAGIPIYATYLFNRNYNVNMDLSELSGLVAYAIQETASQDQRVGGPITLIQITGDGYRELVGEEVQQILNRYPLNERYAREV